MFHRSCRCVFLIIGALMLLLALALALNIDYDATPTAAYEIQRADVAQAVSWLESGCLTCHELTNANPASARVYALDERFNPRQNYQPMIASEQASIAPPMRNQLHTHLIETGHRILNLPAMRDQRVGTVMEDYLHVYAQASTTPSEQTTQWALWQLDEIENLLGLLENQALPYQLVRPENSPTQPDSAVLHTLTTAPNVAVVAHTVSLGDVVPVIVTRPESASLAMPVEVAYATQRRGPPAGAYLDSVV